jgi:hypothetical protein
MASLKKCQTGVATVKKEALCESENEFRLPGGKRLRYQPTAQLGEVTGVY